MKYIYKDIYEKLMADVSIQFRKYISNARYSDLLMQVSNEDWEAKNVLLQTDDKDGYMGIEKIL